MIIDAFLFCQEYSMLEFRLQLLYDYVDKFVILEADNTFSGLDKPFNFEEYRTRYAWSEGKIKYFKLHCDISSLNLAEKPIEYLPTHDCWQIEYAQRNAIVTACEGFLDDDILILSDVDEIPSLEAIERAKENVRMLPVVCQQHFFYYNLRRLRQETWLGSVFSPLSTARSLGTQELRNRRNVLTRIANAGWHLSYFDDSDNIRNKIEFFSHQELNRQEFKSDEHINRCISTGEDLFNRDVKTIEVRADFFPSYFIKKAMSFNWALNA